MKFRRPEDYPSYRSKLLDDFRRSRERANTRLQNKWIEEVKKTGDLNASAKKVYAKDAPGSIVKRNMAKPSIRDEVEGLMDDVGCGTKNALEVIGKAMTATRPGYTDEDGIFVKGEADHRVRMDAAKETLKLKDAYPKGTTTHEHRHLHAVMVEELSELSFEKLTHMMQAEILAAGEPTIVKSDEQLLSEEQPQS